MRNGAVGCVIGFMTFVLLDVGYHLYTHPDEVLHEPGPSPLFHAGMALSLVGLAAIGVFAAFGKRD